MFPADNGDGPVKLGDGEVRFMELDAEKMGEYFTNEPNSATFDCVWISEAMSKCRKAPYQTSISDGKLFNL